MTGVMTPGPAASAAEGVSGPETKTVVIRWTEVSTHERTVRVAADFDPGDHDLGDGLAELSDDGFLGLTREDIEVTDTTHDPTVELFTPAAWNGSWVPTTEARSDAAPAADVAGTPGFVVTTPIMLQRTSIDDATLSQWVAETDDDELECLLPDSYQAGAALSNLFYEAATAGVVTSDPRVEICVHADDDPEGSDGYMVLIYNRAGERQWPIVLTSGWQVIATDAADSTASLATKLRHWLDDVCAVANSMIEAVAVAAAPLMSADQITEWAGRALSADELQRMATAIPHSSIPDAINTIAAEAL